MTTPGSSFNPIPLGHENNLGVSSIPDGVTAQLLHRSINRQVANMGAKNDANLDLSPTFRYVSIESPL
ncbi:hypothetical protein TNCV_1980831 [Trichonephila clavipes]|nr:hypothetical protein TNCV_1980831 [Trichonephila clavipes]